MKLLSVLFLFNVVLIAGCSDDKDDIKTTGGDPHLVAYYDFNGDANDASEYGSDGVVNGPTLTTDREAVANQAYLFDGTDDDITVADTNNFRFSSQITITTWIRPDEQKSQVVCRKGGGAVTPLFELSLSGTGDIVFALETNQVRKTGYTTATWVHVAGTYDGSMMRLYVDGILSDSTSIADALIQDTSTLLIGTRTNQASNTFHGAIDEIRIYDVALTQSEIATLAQ